MTELRLEPWWLPCGEKFFHFNSQKMVLLRIERKIRLSDLANWAEISVKTLEKIEDGTMTLHRDDVKEEKIARFLVIGVTGKKEI